MFQSILEEFELPLKDVVVEKYGSGLINNTWIVKHGTIKFILQRVNDNVFKDPNAIADNIDRIAFYMEQQYPDYLFVHPVTAKSGKTLIYKEGNGYFRMFPFIIGSRSIDVVETPSQAFEAASQFGRFTRLLQDFDPNVLTTTIPDFHNLSLRYQQFLLALKNGNAERLNVSKKLIDELEQQNSIVSRFEQISRDENFIKRVTHHDTKISNVLFDKADHGLCVIDLDTMMPGYFFSDLGDMMRTYLSPVSEEEMDYNKIGIRDEFYEAVVNGYYNEMKDVLTKVEKEHFFYAGTFMIYMQAIRFLTDYLNNDPYYGEKYPGHNFVRATNQAVLLKRLFEKRRCLIDVSKIKK